MPGIGKLLNRILYVYGISGAITFGTVLVSNIATINKSVFKETFRTEPGFMSIMIISKSIYYGFVWPQFIYETYKRPSTTLMMGFYDPILDGDSGDEEENKGENDK